jgi:hypothetical protein
LSSTSPKFPSMKTQQNRRLAMKAEMVAILSGYDPILEIACQEVGADYTRRRVSLAGSAGNALIDVYNGRLPETWDVDILESSGGQKLMTSGISIYPGATSAHGRALAPLAR